MKPIINQESCIGCGTCEGICQETFKMDDGKAQVVALDDYSSFKAKHSDCFIPIKTSDISGHKTVINYKMVTRVKPLL